MGDVSVDGCWFNCNCWLTGWLNSRNETVESLADETLKQIDGGMLDSGNLDGLIQCVTDPDSLIRTRNQVNQDPDPGPRPRIY